MQNSLSVIKQPIIKPELLFGPSQVNDYGGMVMTCRMNGAFYAAHNRTR